MKNLIAAVFIASCLTASLAQARPGESKSTMPSEQDVSGGLNRDEVQAVIRANLNQVRYCYEKVLAKEPTVNGKIFVAFKIGADGKILESSISPKTTLAHVGLQTCVTGKLQHWRFPEPRGGKVVDVTYPFVFSPM